MHNVQVTPLIGLPQFNGWSQVVVNHDSTVTVALAVSGQNAGNIGRDLVAQIKETSPANVEAFYRLLQDLKLDTEELGVMLALSSAYVTEHAISYATLRGSVILKRGDKVGRLVASDDQLQLIQGKTQVDDLVVLATQAAGSFLGEMQQKLTQGYSPEIIIKSMAPAIHKEADSAAVSIGFMTFTAAVEAAPETTPGSTEVVDEEAAFEAARDRLLAEAEKLESVAPEPAVVDEDLPPRIEMNPEPVVPMPEPVTTAPFLGRLDGEPEPRVRTISRHLEITETETILDSESQSESAAETQASSFGIPIFGDDTFVPPPVSERVSDLPEIDMSQAHTPVSDFDLPPMAANQPTPAPTPAKPKVPSKPWSERVAPVTEKLKGIGRSLFIAAHKLRASLKRRAAQPPVPQIAAHSVMNPVSAEALVAQPVAYDLPDSQPLTTTPNRSPFGHTPPVYMAPGDQLARRRIMIVVILALICAIGAIVIWRQRQAQQIQAAQTEMAPLLTEFTNVQQQVETDPVTARTRMQEILNEMEVVKRKYDSQPAAQKSIDAEIVDSRSKYDALSGRQEVSSLNVYFDLAQVQSGFLATKLVSDGESLVALDQEKKEIIRLNLADKSARINTLSDLPAKPSLQLTGNQLLVLGGGVKQIDISQDTPTLSEVVPEGDSNREGTLVGRFSNFVYVLNPAKRNIFRYLVQDGEVSEPVGWVKPGQPLPYETMSSFKIDGDVWLATTEGEIIKFTSGDRQEFTITGLSKAFESPIILDTRENVANLYVLEPAAKRIVVLSKTGQFIKEVNSPSLATASDIAVDEARGLVLALSGSLIFEMPI